LLPLRLFHMSSDAVVAEDVISFRSCSYSESCDSALGTPIIDVVIYAL
jgi:hypothetical protein